MYKIIISIPTNINLFLFVWVGDETRKLDHPRYMGCSRFSWRWTKMRLRYGCAWGAAGAASVYISGCRPGVGAVVTAAVRAVNININRTKAGGTVEEMAISGVSTQTEDTRPYHTRPYHTRLRRESELRFACSMADGRQWRRYHQQDWSYIYSCMITMIIIRSTELGVIYILFS